MKWSPLALLLLAGCSHTAWQVSSGTPNAGAQVQVDGGRSLATLLGLGILAAGTYHVVTGGISLAGETSRPPEMAPDRKVSEQDCSRPLDYSLGNIRCK